MFKGQMHIMMVFPPATIYLFDQSARMTNVIMSLCNCDSIVSSYWLTIDLPVVATSLEVALCKISKGCFQNFLSAQKNF